ncbi:MAG: hypothetical protein LUD77_07620 [Clostridiales bacterium]|nr:hypothetical protein [Clostridiales bacterium]
MKKNGFFKKLFAEKDNKTFINIFTALAVGIGLILIGGMFDDKNNDKPADTAVVSENTPENDADYKAALEDELEKILGQVSGVGNIEIMITLKNDGKSSLAEDITREKSDGGTSGNSEKEEYKTLLTGEDQPYIINKSYPEVEGILITCGGGGAVEVKSSLISACCALFGIDANKIEVLKMGGN